MSLWSSGCAGAAVGFLMSAEDGSSSSTCYFFFGDGRSGPGVFEFRFWLRFDGLAVIPWIILVVLWIPFVYSTLSWLG